MFQKVAELTPDSFRGYANLGGRTWPRGKYTEAIEPLNMSLESARLQQPIRIWERHTFTCEVF